MDEATFQDLAAADVVTETSCRDEEVDRPSLVVVVDYYTYSSFDLVVVDEVTLYPVDLRAAVAAAVVAVEEAKTS